MADPEHGEKEEKHEEKDEKEHTEKEEKQFDEKWRRDPLSAVIWAAILIWAGLVFLAENLGLFVPFEGFSAWGLVFVGAGLIILLEVVVRLLMPDYRRPVTGTIIFGVILIGIGLGDLVSWNLIWPLVLIVIGAGILLGGFRGRR